MKVLVRVWSVGMERQLSKEKLTNRYQMNAFLYFSITATTAYDYTRL